MALARILVVDDTPANVKLLADLLTIKGYEVATAPNGEEGLKRLAEQRPDLVLLDVMMPGINGYEVCRAIRADPSTGVLPVVMVTSLDPAQERIKGLEAGADDFLTKPINQAELLARVKSLLRIKSLYDQLGELNANLEKRVAEQVAQLDRFARLKRFVSPRIGDLIIAGEVDDPLKTHRREITVVFTDLRGFTNFSETAEPEEAMDVLRAYHGELGRIAMAHEGTIEHFAGDGVMILFNDPIPIGEHELAAIRMALEMRQAVGALGTGWKKRGYDLGFGIGIANGYATLGAIGFEGRRDYGAIGPVTNLSARLCSEAKAGQILISQRLYGKVEERVEAESVGELPLKGIQRAVGAYNVLGLRE
ncbi:MAG: guanylate cyclase [Betaproteobacteria bacterium RIFCSPLOWO2_02_FULL_66_14]|nr:MAG: guanylate cyclase [Betaproteobacteria bacterium RIFCSPLOWO2_02_FULL_66_14]